MSFAKRMLEEEQAREYVTSDDTVCADCFTDIGIKDFISENLEAKHCSVCGRKARNKIAIRADKFLEFFINTVNENYENADGHAPFDTEDGRYMVDTWDTYDLVFDELCDIAEQETLDWIYSRLKGDLTYCRKDWQIMSPGEAMESGWETFCYAVKHKSRFLFFTKDDLQDENEPFLVQPAEMLEALGEAIHSCGLIRRINTDNHVFRARLHAPEESYSSPVDLGPPPEIYAKGPGRMNAPGIAVMYASYDVPTVLLEATGKHRNASVGEFELLKPALVVDLTDIPQVPSIFESGPRESLRFLHRFAEDVSQPFTPDIEIHIEYTPTQVVSEYIRHRLTDKKGEQILGVLYKSAKQDGGTNLALFIESGEVEGVESEGWRKKEPVIRLLRTEEKSLGGLTG